MANKNSDFNNDNRQVNINDDYIELLESVSAEEEYEDIYSDSSRDVYSDSSKDVYIGKARQNTYIEDEDAVYINKKSHRIKINPEFIEIDDKSPTGEMTKVTPKAPPLKKPRKDYDEDEISDFDARRKSKKKQNPIGAILVILLALVVGFAGVVAFSAGGIVSKFKEAEEIEHIEDVDSLKTASYVKNILLIGSDKKTGDSSRSDSIMIASVNSKTGKITIVSILRDTHLYIPGEREAKVNAAYSWGGANLLIQTIEHNFGIKIDEYATVDFDMFKALVDGVGGIYVDVSDAEAEHMNSYFKLGTQGKPEKVQSGENVYLDGYHALCYARIRKLDSDFYRTERQRKIISAIAENIKDDLNPAGVFELMDTAKEVAPYIETTLSQGEFWSLAINLGGAFVKSGGEIDKLLINEKIPFDDTWWYSSEWDGSSISINLDENKKLLQDLLFAEEIEDIPQTIEE